MKSIDEITVYNMILSGFILFIFLYCIITYLNVNRRIKVRQLIRLAEDQLELERKAIKEERVFPHSSGAEKPFILERQPDLCDIQKNWGPLLTIEKIGIFEMYSPTADIFKWRLLSKEGEETLLKSTSDYVSEVTCKHGIDSVIKSIRSAAASTVKPNPFIVGEDEETKEFSYVLKAGNGKIIGVGPMVVTEKEAEDFIAEITARVLSI